MKRRIESRCAVFLGAPSMGDEEQRRPTSAQGEGVKSQGNRISNCGMILF
jgi:hypothetical protein